MACSPTTLLADAAPFSGIDEGFIQNAKLALLVRWLLELDPLADVTPQALSDAAQAQYGGLSEGQLAQVRLQLLCQISEA